MKVAIAGAGAVGRSIARELVGNGHSVLLVDKNSVKITPDRIPGADWLLGDACEVENLENAGLEGYDVMISATGDDKVNLVVSLLAKTEFSVRRVVARINHPPMNGCSPRRGASTMRCRPRASLRRWSKRPSRSATWYGCSAFAKARPT